MSALRHAAAHSSAFSNAQFTTNLPTWALCSKLSGCTQSSADHMPVHKPLCSLRCICSFLDVAHYLAAYGLFVLELHAGMLGAKLR